MKRVIYILLQYLYMIECSQESNNTDVFVTYAGHSEVLRPIPETKGEEATTIDRKQEMTKKSVDVNHGVTDAVIFVPNDKPIFRNEDLFHDDPNATRRVVGGIADKKIHFSETESPKDVLFISGKNKEHMQKPAEFVKKQVTQESTVVRTGKAVKNRPLNCTNLDCNSTVNSVCGGKEDNSNWRYRLFLNECFFRKVNCGFQHAVNRYRLVPMEKCKNSGAHYLSRSYVFKPKPLPAPKNVSTSDARRSFSSRRSLNMGVDGSFCGHACPASCTEDYDPQCAVSVSGQMKMFLNHCKLDHNSCLYKVVWHRRPLSECVGGRKADMTQNRGFIGWMQRVGIVDRKGKLMLS